MGSPIDPSERVGMTVPDSLPPRIADLACPRCKRPLPTTDRCDGCGTVFAAAAGLPVLIDFDDSICNPEDFIGAEIQPPRANAGAIGRLLQRMTFGRSEASRDNIARFANLVAEEGGRRVLVIGGGTEGDGTESLYQHPELESVGTDIYPSPSVAIICDGHSLPFADGSFNGVLIQAVLEHVLEPQRVVNEIERVLEPDGLVYAETPFLQAVHMGAHDFTRFTKSGHRWLFRRFTEVDSGTVLGPGVVALWSINHLFTGAFGKKVAALLTAPFFWVRMVDRRASARARADGASALYFLGRRRDPGLTAAAMREYYEASER